MSNVVSVMFLSGRGAQGPHLGARREAMPGWPLSRPTWQVEIIENFGKSVNVENVGKAE